MDDGRLVMLGGQQFTPAYNQMHDLESQKTVFTGAINNNNKALAQLLYPTLLYAFQGTHGANFHVELKNYLLWLAHTVAPTCQLETMIYLFNLRSDNERMLLPNNDQYITLMIATADQAVFLYLAAKSHMTMENFAPYLDDFTENNLQGLRDLFQDQPQQQQPQNRNGFVG